MISAIIPVYKEPNVLNFRYRLIHALNFWRDWEIVWCVGDPQSFAFLNNVYKNDSMFGDRTEKIVYEPERGLGRAIKTGIAAASPKADWILTMDSDGQQLPEQLRFLYEPVRLGMNKYFVTAVTTKYLLDARNWKRKLISRIATWILVKRHGLGVSNVTSNYRLYRAEVLRDVAKNLTSLNFAIQPEILIRIKKGGYLGTFAEVGIDFVRRDYGKSKSKLSAREYLRLLRL